MFGLFTNKKTAISLGLLILFFSLFTQFTSIQPFNEWRTRIELFAYDLRLNFFLDKTIEKDKRIIIIDVDEKSLKKEGRWPWSRKKIAQLVNELGNAGAIVIGFDFIFSEPERNPVNDILQHLNTKPEQYSESINTIKKLNAEFNYDDVLAKSFKNKDIVLGYITFVDDKNKSIGELPAPLKSNIKDIDQLKAISFQSYISNLGVLQDNAVNAGYFTFAPDQDGVIRRFPLVANINGKLYSSLPFEIFRVYNLIDSIKVKTEVISNKKYFSGLEVVANKVIPTDGVGQVIIPYRGKAGSFNYYSATDILQGKYQRKDIENKIVLIGTTSIGLFDLRVVPVQKSYPGVEVIANIISGLLDNSFSVEPPWAPGANFAFMIIVGLILAFTLPFLSPLLQLLLSVSILIILIIFNGWLWSEKGLVLTIVLPVFMVATLAVFNFLFGFMSESFSRRKLHTAFGQYIPPELVNRMDKNLSQYGFEGESREMTVLFSDIVGFTTISEQLSATELKNLLNDYLTPMTKVIFDNNGTIDKYIGDLIMAFWGAPIKDEKHASHALSSSLKMLQALEELNKQFSKRNLPSLSVGIGINTGTMNVGDMGSTFRRAYTVIGDSVNLASRLEGLTRYFGVDVLLSEDTAMQAGNDFLLMQIGSVKVKGKNEAVKIFTLLGLAVENNKTMQAKKIKFELFLESFNTKNWLRANDLLSELIHKYGEQKLFKFYMEQLNVMKNNDPDDSWQGEIIFTEK